MTTKQSRRNLVRRPMKRICNGALVFLIVLYTSTAANASPTIRHDFIFVKGGTFTMGTTDGPVGSKPPHQVRVSDFWIGKYDVTQALWKSVMKHNPSRFLGDNRPVEYVTWYDAVTFCNALSNADGLLPAYSINFTSTSANPVVIADRKANGYRLPTEAEWEYAARGGDKATTQRTDYSGSANPDQVAWYSKNSDGRTHPVGQKQANELGLFDMSGNVMEWCYDRYAVYSSDALVDPNGALSGGYRVVRGGGFDFGEFYLKVYWRTPAAPDEKGADLGFRLVHKN